MKKLMILALGLGIALGSVSFAQEAKAEKKTEKKAKKAKKAEKSDKKM